MNINHMSRITTKYPMTQSNSLIKEVIVTKIVVTTFNLIFVKS